MTDNVAHPHHYAGTVPGIECIEVVQHFNFNRGNVIKYVWRAGAKGDGAKEIEDLKKARQYLDFEIARLQATPKSGSRIVAVDLSGYRPDGSVIPCPVCRGCCLAHFGKHSEALFSCRDESHRISSDRNA